VYSTCLFCHGSLGSNQVIEQLPIGRRLAFDSALGRLWVVCAKCRRWNLTPIEERWEAIQDCERRYRNARVRTSTDQIGLARLSEGLELVRIGAPPRAELAAWQYVDVFRRRRQRAIALTAVAATVAFGAGVAWLAAVASAQVLIQLTVQTAVNVGRGPAVRVARPDGKRLVLAGGDLSTLSIEPRTPDAPLTLTFKRDRFWSEPSQYTYHGEHAERTLRPILARLNRFSGRPAEVALAVEQLNREGDPLAPDHQRFGKKSITVKTLYPVDRLAFEMSLAERDEQRLLAGELASLTDAWREAEEVAAIADNLFVPESVTAWLRRQKSRP
jgi:hypothetical protein